MYYVFCDKHLKNDTPQKTPYTKFSANLTIDKKMHCSLSIRTLGVNITAIGLTEESR